VNKVSDVNTKVVPGYVSSKHIFGRSLIVRAAKGFHYLKWQWSIKDVDVDNIISLTKEQYQKIKSMLLPYTHKEEIPLSDKSNAVHFIHPTSSKNYMQIKRYLVKNKILKENRHGYRITTRSKIY
jgi:hypothetical protein